MLLLGLEQENFYSLLVVSVFFRFYLTGEKTFLSSGGRAKGDITVTGVHRAPTDRVSRNGPAVGKGMATG